MNEPIIFFGTPDLAAETLEALIRKGYPISAVVSRPDRKKNRHMLLQETPVKKTAEKYRIPVLQPERPDDSQFVDRLKTFEASFFLVIAYGKILGDEILAMPKKACLNIHYSLLPRYRGAAPIHFALMDGNSETGVSVIKMTKKMDAGDVVITKKTAITPNETIVELTKKLTQVGIDAAMEALSDYDGHAPVPQNHLAATYTKKITPELGRIDRNQSAACVHNVFRALYPLPGVYFMLKKKRIKITAMELCTDKNAATAEAPIPGTVVRANKDGIWVACYNGGILIVGLKPENKREITAVDFINGYSIKAGMSLW